MPPTAAQAATPEPVIAAKNTLASTTTNARPPVKWPTRAWQKDTIRREIPPLSIRAPAMMKNGTASRVKVLTLANICCRTTMGETLLNKAIYRAEDPPKAKAIGAPSRMKMKKEINRTITPIKFHHLILLLFELLLILSGDQYTRGSSIALLKLNSGVGNAPDRLSVWNSFRPLIISSRILAKCLTNLGLKSPYIPSRSCVTMT